MPEDTGPVEVTQPVTQMGATFAERKAAREAAEKKTVTKQVDDTAESVEDKAIKPAESERSARKKS